MKRKTFEEASGFNVKPLLPSHQEPETKSKHRFKKQRTEQPAAPPSSHSKSLRAQRRDRQKEKDMTCFACRQKGHSVSNCPSGGDNKPICYKCGGNDHSVSKCRAKVDPSNPYPFAECFVCKQKGHLSGACPNNANGLYPNGGGCKYCGSKTHLAKDCRPTKQGKNLFSIVYDIHIGLLMNLFLSFTGGTVGSIQVGMIDLNQGGDDDDVFLALRKMADDKKGSVQAPNAAKPIKKKVVAF